MKIKPTMIFCIFALISCFTFAQEKAFTIPEKELIPEGIAYDQASGDLFLGSLNQGRILRIKSDGSYSDFIKPDAKDPMKIVGMEVDNKRNLLWACVANSYQMNENTRQANRYTGLHKFDLTSGKLLGKYYVVIKNKDHLANDLVVMKNGDIYFTSYYGEMLYKLSPNSTKPEEFFAMKGIASNGIAVSDDEKTLFISGNEELFNFQIKSKTFNEIKAPKGEILGHADGLYLYKNTLVGVCHQTRNQKYSAAIRQYQLSADGLTVISCLDLARDHQDFVIPTTGAVVGNQLYFIATSHLNNFKDSKIADPENTKDVLIMKVGLK